MNTLLNFEKFKLMENKTNYNISEKDVEYLKRIADKCNGHSSGTFFLKDIVTIGTCDKGDVFANYMTDSYGDIHISILFNKKSDKMYGVEYDFAIISIDDELNVENSPFAEKVHVSLFDNFMSIIISEIKSYDDLDEWCEKLKDYSSKEAAYFYKWSKYKDNPENGLTWDEQIEWEKIKIEKDKLVNRHLRTGDEKRLKDMLELGEVEYNKKQKKWLDFLSEL